MNPNENENENENQQLDNNCVAKYSPGDVTVVLLDRSGASLPLGRR